MPYTKQTWSDTPGVSPLSAARLNYMEQGIEDAALSGGGGLQVPIPKSTSTLINIPINPTTTGAVELNRLVLMPIYVGRDITNATKLWVQILGTAVPNATARLGVYSIAADAEPGDLIVQTAAFDTSTTGIKQATIPTTSFTQGTYWMAYVAQTATATVRLQGNNAWPTSVWGATGQATSNGETNYTHRTITNVTGALPSSAASAVLHFWVSSAIGYGIVGSGT